MIGHPSSPLVTHRRGPARSGQQRPLTAIDLVLAATIAAAFAALAVQFSVLQESLRLALGLYGGMVTAGVWQLPGIVLGAIVRKPWAAFIAQNLFGVAQFLFGSPYGVLVMSFTLAEAIGQEVVFRAFSSRMGDWRVWGLAGAVSVVCAAVPNYLIFGLGSMPLWSVVGPILFVSIPSGVLCATVVASLVVSAVKRSGGLRWSA